MYFSEDITDAWVCSLYVLLRCLGIYFQE